MRVLVFEFITGGGLVGQALPASLATEGSLMLQALIAELKCLDDLQLCVPLDERCARPDMLLPGEIVTVSAACDIFALLRDLLTQADLFWPVAPESDSMLQSLAELAIAANVEVLLSNPAALSACANKYATYQALKKRMIPAVATHLLSEAKEGIGLADKLVVKIADGVGCLDSLQIDAEQLPAAIAELTDPHRYVLQPYIHGQAASLSCLFKHGQAWLICYNHQQIALQQGRFSLQGCLVNLQTDKLSFYRNLVSEIADALPGLWGYVGIDVIENAKLGPLVLEINPRLTSSYVGIRQATGINVAEQVLRLRHAEPVLQPYRNETVQIHIN
ncbi:ATP-grasp domain-containing protein [Methylomonas sp. ZR1]|uniref:ATP-grasp domain-containing protein n=1 Tax=Methylomonas sp. ZR1 TaxID=1797072 RepID=UPI0014924361|nr:ATP-grasp domain-containing protein [Methylomonas sp. ZR1]NOV30030.1 ATP-grasp domain-containing protein [Methylomonas sp. ZR1]